MLKAILSGKSGRIPQSVEPGDSWSAAIKHSEDLLTSTVFERLAYLDASVLWSLLKRTFGSLLPDFRVAELDGMQFWPNWYDPTTGGVVEPDVFIEFSLGDPVRKIAIICEAKLGQLQYANQWQRQWMAYQHQVSIGEAQSDEVFLLAIGGLTGHQTQMVEQFQRTIHTATMGDVSIKAAAADWRRLADAVHEETQSATGSTARVLLDISEALSLFGYRHIDGLASLSEFTSLRDPVAGLTVIRSLKL